jgi:hypothetical protein
MQTTCLSTYSPHPNAPDDLSTPRFDGSQVQSSSFFNSKFKVLLMHESNFHVTKFSYGSNTHDARGRVSSSQEDFNVAATASSRASRLEF